MIPARTVKQVGWYFVLGWVASSLAWPAGAEPLLREPARTRQVESVGPAIDFELTGLDGRPARFSALRGQASLVFFGFSHCRSVCPAAMQKLREARRAMAGAGSPPTVVLVSVDGERDTPDVLARFLEPFGGGFVGFTGAPAAVRPIANQFKAIFFKGGPTDAAGGYDVEHTSQIYLVDAEGRMRATFYDAPVEDIVAVARTL